MAARHSLCLLLLAAACGNGHGPFYLTVSGSRMVHMNAGDRRELRVVLSEGQDGPVAGARLHFELRDGDTAGATLDPADPVTDEHGIATARLTAGGVPFLSPRVVITAPGRDVLESAEIGLDISTPDRRLQPLESPASRVAPPDLAFTTVGVSTRTLLRVREVDHWTGLPVAGDAITFTRPANTRSSLAGESGGAVTVRTGPEGEAQVLLVSSQLAEGPFPVTASSGPESVNFVVTVQAAPSQCVSSQTCAAGNVCVGGVCQDPGSGSCTGAACPPASPGAPDVTGVWLTEHTFDLRAALPLGLRAVGVAFRVLDQVLHGKIEIPGLAGWSGNAINALLSKLVALYLPDWAPLAVQVGDDLFTVASTLRAEGSMRLTRGADLAHPKGTEVWTKLVFYWLPLCNGNLGSDPTVPPDCARIELPTTDAENPGAAWTCEGKPRQPIAVKLAPFTASVAQATGGYGLATGERQVTIGMGAAIRLLTDTLVSLTTQGDSHCIEELTDCGEGHACIVDCLHLGRDVMGWTGGLVDLWSVDAACRNAVTASGQVMANALEAAWPNALEVLSFQGQASVSGQADTVECESGQMCAGQLGVDGYEGRLRAGTATDGGWTGSFLPGALGNVPGAWEAKRRP